ncbi:GNAT family N-acetyltransferase [Mesorhizobium sp. ZC-5]|uniref:GNAT family N-acetyltransferase n=1 Tax=Mesorhizobium sp. ZC-5 TaxID=2986066 RepID=UPI0021E747BF|nr:GNAT family N-acetyltransferase [Mesorhizobium sp. ZC-5]MCV3239026.1 GNAT family N-acetyltransferase [Mesorhizobium sp. ZC-5]
MPTIIDGTSSHLDTAAQIWAEATSARDGDDDVPPLGISRPIIVRVLESSRRALLLVILNDAGEAVGFAAIAPVPGNADMAELHYVGVSPRAWGGGFGKQLMAAVPAALRKRGFTAAKLAVYADNPRAVRLYEHLGWRRHGDPEPHPRSSRPEQEYRLSI